MKTIAIAISVAIYCFPLMLSAGHASDELNIRDVRLLEIHARDDQCSVENKTDVSLIEERMQINPHEEIVSLVCQRHPYHNSYAVYWLRHRPVQQVTRLTFRYFEQGEWKYTSVLSRVSLDIGRLKLSSIEKWDRAPNRQAALSPWATGSASIYVWDGSRFRLVKYHIKTRNDGRPFLFFEDRDHKVDLTNLHTGAR